MRVVPEHARPRAREPLGAQLRGLRRGVSHRAFWDIALASVTVQATSMAIQGLWAGPWLRDVAGAVAGRRGGASAGDGAARQWPASCCGATWRRGSRGAASPICSVLAAGMGGFLVVQLLLTVGWTGAPALLWIAFGVFGTAGSVSLRDSVASLSAPSQADA